LNASARLADQPQCILVITGATPEGFRKAVDCPIKDRDALLAFYDVPAEHCCICEDQPESTFATVRHRTIRSEGLPVEQTALAMVFRRTIIKLQARAAARPRPSPGFGDSSASIQAKSLWRTSPA